MKILKAKYTTWNLEDTGGKMSIYHNFMFVIIYQKKVSKNEENTQIL